MRALLIGRCPPRDLGYTYGDGAYDAVVIGSLSLGQLLCFDNEEVLSALAEGKPVILYTPGLPEAPKNRALAAALASKRRELKNWGVLFADGTQKRLVTAAEAEKMRQSGKRPGPGAVLTPLAREILEGSD
jgi:hypothetical protein